jgi:hypothetical protein
VENFLGKELVVVGTDNFIFYMTLLATVASKGPSNKPLKNYFLYGKRHSSSSEVSFFIGFNSLSLNHSRVLIPDTSGNLNLLVHFIT